MKFKDEEIRSFINKNARIENNNYIKQQIQENLENKNQMKDTIKEYERKILEKENEQKIV